MSTRETWQHSQLGYQPPPPRIIAWFGVELVPVSLLIHWPKGLGRAAGERLMCRLGLDPLNRADRDQRAAGTAFASSPLRRQRFGMATLTDAMRNEG